MKPRNKNRAGRWLTLLLVAAVLLPAGYYAARRVAWPAYKSWRQARFERMTREFLANGDYDNALLTARQALEKNPRSIAHWRLAAAAAKAKGSADAMFYQQNVAKLDHRFDSQLELLRLETHYGDFRDAVETIEAINPAAKQSAEFHELAARVYREVGRPTSAKLHLYSLVSLRPDDRGAQLDLAELELREDTAGKDPALREKVRTLGQSPELKARAWLLLLDDALARGRAAEAATLAGELRPLSTLTGPQRVRVLEGLTRGDAAAEESYLRELETSFATDPQAAVALVDYFRRSGRRAEAQQWFDALPKKTREDASVQEALAATFLEWREWARLDETLKNARWAGREFVHAAFAAYSARENGRMAEAGSAWRLAVIQAGDSARNTSELLALVSRWGWQSEQYDLVWKLFALMPRNESISSQLLAWERAQGHTANLNRIFARLAEFSGDDRMVKNNLAYSSLLLEANVPRAIELARDNFRADPANPFFVTTYALALYRQNKPAEALATIEGLRPSALSLPERMMLRALFRVSTGDAAGAADLLGGVRAEGFLPEERQLMAAAVSEITRLQGEKGESARLLALSRSGEVDHRRGWMHVLPQDARVAATVEMQASDSFLALGDIAGLGNQVRRGSWGNWEHIRLSLASFVARTRRDDGSARFFWRAALGNAGGDVVKLRQLKTLAEQWKWPAENADVLGRLFATDPSDRGMFTELMNYYRSTGRTAELVSVLSAYLSTYPNDQMRLCDFAYYSMLSGLNVTRAYVTAQEIYHAAPSDADRRLVYAFALWKQRRAADALEVLEHLPAKMESLVPAALLRAAVLADLGRREEAIETLKAFNPKGALPEEASLANRLADRLATSQPRISQTD